MKRRLLALLLVSCLLCGCQSPGEEPRKLMEYGLFDTVTTILAAPDYAGDFEAQAREILSELEEYHRLLDIYQEYEGLVNLKTLNDQAGKAPVQVDPRLMDFLLKCREYYELTDGLVNPALGSVLQLWHWAREEGLQDPEHSRLPEPQALQAAAEHCRMEDVILDPAEGTVYFRDPLLKLDAGALGKGWAAEQVCGSLPSGLLVSVGGNVRATGPKGQEPWTVGIQDPEDPGQYAAGFPLNRGSAVTSGDYQRYYEVEGKRYHHIIDPGTGMPGGRWRSVTVVTEDSGLADCLSTALFLMDRDSGQQLLDRVGAEALWIDGQGEIFRSPGFPK